MINNRRPTLFIFDDIEDKDRNTTDKELEEILIKVFNEITTPPTKFFILKESQMSRSLGFVNVIDPTTNEITPIRYDEFVKKLFKLRGAIQYDLDHALIGCAGEVGELCDAIKKFSIYGKDIDISNVIEELGDLRFYIQAVMNLLDIPEQSILQNNANKLAKRYQGLVYTDKAAIARADKIEDGKGN